MIPRAISLPSLTQAGLLSLACAGLLLLAFGPGWAQSPSQPRVDNPTDPLTAAAQEPSAKPSAANDALRLQLRLYEQGLAPKAAVALGQSDLDAKRAHLEQQLQQLLRALDQLKTQAKPETPGAATAKPKVAPSSGLVRPALAPAAGLKAPGNLEQRLDQVEHKLDTLLWEVTNLRRDLTKGHGGPIQVHQGGGYPPVTMTPPGNGGRFQGAPGGPGGAGGPGAPGVPGGYRPVPTPPPAGGGPAPEGLPRAINPAASPPGGEVGPSLRKN